MAYQALYRKYRPQFFKDVVGQTATVQTLENSINSNSFSHAYLFCGPRGTGKTTVARIFSKALNCSSKEQRPCGECISCQEISQSRNNNVIEIDAASNNGVDEIRNLKEKVRFLPSGAKHRIYIIDEVHMLSTGAFNALLKTLEEPPKHAIFILATTEPNKIPPTITSRCQKFTFKSIKERDIKRVVEDVSASEGVNIDEEAKAAISEIAEGSIRDALSFLDQAIAYGNNDVDIDTVNQISSSIDVDKLILLLSNIYERNIINSLNNIREFFEEGKSASKIVESMLAISRDVLLYKQVGEEHFNKRVFEREQFKEIASKIDTQMALYFVELLCDASEKIKYLPSPRVYLEIVIMKMYTINKKNLELFERVDELEQRIANVNVGENIIVDDEKYEKVNNKIDSLRAELAKLELPQVEQRVRELENNSNLADPTNAFNQSIKIEKIEDDIIELKQNAIANKVSGGTAPAVDEKYLEKQEELNNLVHESNALYGDELRKLNEEIKLLKFQLDAVNIKGVDFDKKADEFRDSENKYQEVVAMNQKLAAEVERLNNKIENMKHSPQQPNTRVEESGESLDRITKLEKTLYKMIAEKITSTAKPKSKTKIAKGQMMLFQDEVISINDFDKKQTESVSFEGVLEEKEIPETPQAIKELHEKKTVPAVMPKVEETHEEGDSQETIVSKTDPIIEEKEQPKIEVEKEVTPKADQPLETPKKEAKPLFSVPEIKQEKPKTSKVISSYFDVNTQEKVITKEKSNLVIREKREETPEEISHSILTQVKKEDETITGKRYVAPANHQEIIVSQPQKVGDKFARYDIKDFEQILYDSVEPNARNDKAKVMSAWKTLNLNTNAVLLPVAEILMDGEIEAVGSREIVVSFPSVNQCNTVMRFKFKKEAMKLLYDKLGDVYNYIALPKEVWQEKRTEYVSQYQIGTIKPKLKPFNIPGLQIIREEDEYLNKDQQKFKNLCSAFGDDIVKIKGE